MKSLTKINNNGPEALLLLAAVFAFSQKRKVKLYLVGGFLRDIVLKRQKREPDIDFAIKNNAIGFGRQLAKQIKAGFVVLDKEHGCCRLVKKLNQAVYTLDFTDFRGKDLKDDLSHRDFTINCLALDLKDALQRGDFTSCLIDPLSGQKDLKTGLIKLAKASAYDEDPLRILRAFSLSAAFNFKIEKNTLALIKKKAKKLAAVSFERIRDELFKILACRDSSRFIVKLDRLKILPLIIPEIEKMRGVYQGPYHHLDVLKHSFETLRQLEIVLEEYAKNQEVNIYLDKYIAASRQRRQLLKLAAFLHDIGKPAAKRRVAQKTIFHGHERIGSGISKEIVKRLKLSNDELFALQKMVFLHLRPGYMAGSAIPSRRAKFRFFRDAGEEAVSVFLLSLADQRSTCGRLATKQSHLKHEKAVAGLIKEYFVRSQEKKIIRLVNGDQLMAKFGLKPGPLVGKILSQIEELQALGKVRTREEAFSAGNKLLLKLKGASRA